MIELQENTFQCPGEPYTISRSVHLGRLATFDERCRRCVHRQEMGSLAAALVEQLRLSWNCDGAPLFEDEGASGFVGETLNANTSRRLGAAFGAMLIESIAATESPAVMLAGDGRAATADLVAAASEGLRWSGCQVIEAPAATAACLVFTQQQLSAVGGLLVSNASGAPRSAGLRFFGPAGQPVSAEASPGDATLKQLQQKHELNLNRPARRYGSWGRGSAEEEYLATLAGYFHALRPLKFLFETSSAPLRRYLDQLLASVACRAVSPAESAGSLHFGFWSDGDGERCRVSDEKGNVLEPQRVLVLLGDYLLTSRPGAAMIVEEHTPDNVVSRLELAGARVIRTAASRAMMHWAMRREDALLGGGPSGRFWLCAGVPLPDALHVLALLLSILSQSDRPLSAIV